MDLEEQNIFYKRRYTFCYEFSQKWQDLGISALVTPNFPHCSFKAKNADDMGLMLEYIFLWNVLNYPCGVIPVTTVREDEQEFTDHHLDSWTGLIDETCKESKNMPMTIQVVAHSYEDEKVLAVMHSIDKNINFKMPVPDIKV